MSEDSDAAKRPPIPSGPRRWFFDRVLEYFGYLERDLGFEVTRLDDNDRLSAVAFTNEGLQVVVLWASQDIEADFSVDFRVLHQRYIHGVPAYFDLEHVIAVRAPHLHSTFGWDGWPATLDAAISQQAQLVRDYASDVLEGDLTIMAPIRDLLLARGYGYAGEDWWVEDSLEEIERFERFMLETGRAKTPAGQSIMRDLVLRRQRLLDR